MSSRQYSEVKKRSAQKALKACSSARASASGSPSAAKAGHSSHPEAKCQGWQRVNPARPRACPILAHDAGLARAVVEDGGVEVEDQHGPLGEAAGVGQHALERDVPIDGDAVVEVLHRGRAL